MMTMVTQAPVEYSSNRFVFVQSQVEEEIKKEPTTATTATTTKTTKTKNKNERAQRGEAKKKWNTFIETEWNTKSA